MNIYRIAPLALTLLSLLACGRKNRQVANIPTAPVTRRTIIIDAQAAGTVEPINVVEVKSKASGVITRMPVETGTAVKPGALLAQIDTRDVQNQYNQALADVRAAEARLEVSGAQKRRADEMFRARVITAQEHEASTLDFANAQAQVVRARASLDLAKQRLEDATVTAPVAGTVIEKAVSLGQVITSATGAFGGGTTLLKMADLSRVRVRALFNETDIGQVRPAQPATVVVDAYPDRRFAGMVEKIEPQAVVQQGVTMFPVLITLDNREGLLKPGMNGEVSVLIDERVNVLAVPNDAVRNTREAVATAPLLGLDPDSVQAQLRAQFGGRRGNAGDGGPGVRLQSEQGQQERRFGGRQQVEVSDRQCADVRTALARRPAERRKLEELQTRARAADADRTTIFGEMRTIYQAIGVDASVAMACRRRERSAADGGGATRDGNDPVGSSTRLARPADGVTADPGAAPVRTRPGLVFVAEGNTFKPRVVMLGAGNYDFTEVVSGLREGERVAILAALAVQAQREEQNERFRSRMGGIPGMQQQGGGGAGPRGGGQRGGGPR
ncbi:MAG: efflux RND transporter periplasmic adaptor subunit [Gemmatimonadota bacterium]|nr:efflux RND transporter periplasmic adaptor subunit [Gemmatimonadota bacterium]